MNSFFSGIIRSAGSSKELQAGIKYMHTGNIIVSYVDSFYKAVAGIKFITGTYGINGKCYGGFINPGDLAVEGNGILTNQFICNGSDIICQGAACLDRNIGVVINSYL